MAQTETLQPAQVAALLAVDPATIRRWAAWHIDHVSAGANPPPGGRREFTRRDVEVLRTVQALRREGLATSAINARLQGLIFAELAAPEDQPTTPDGLGTQETVLAAPFDLAPLQNALQPALQAQADRIDRIERRLESSLIIFVVGFAAGAVVVALAILVAVMARGG